MLLLALAALFIALKLLGKIHWSWIWVLAPVWIPLLVGLLLGGAGIGGVIAFG